MSQQSENVTLEQSRNVPFSSKVRMSPLDRAGWGCVLESMRPHGVAPGRTPKADATDWLRRIGTAPRSGSLAPEGLSVCGLDSRVKFPSQGLGQPGARSAGRFSPGAPCCFLALVQLVTLAIAMACFSVGPGRAKNPFIQLLLPPARGTFRGCAAAAGRWLEPADRGCWQTSMRR